MDENSIVTKIFYKRDAYTEELRISKTVTISLIVFILFFILFLWIDYSDYGYFIAEDFIIAIIFAAIFAVPCFIIGWIISYFIDSSARKSRMRMNPQQGFNNGPYVQQPAFNNAAQQQQVNVQPNVQQPAFNNAAQPQQVNVQQPAVNTPQPQNVNVQASKEEIISKVGMVAQGFSKSDVESDYDFLKAQGDDSVMPILAYLKNNAGQNSRFSGKKLLVQLLGDIGTDKAYEAASEILFTSSNCTGWYDDVVSESARVLGDSGDKKWIPTLNKSLDEYFAPVAAISKAIEKLSGEEVKHPNVILDDVMHNRSGLDAIEYLYSLDTSNFDNEQMAFYYYIMAFNAKKVPSLALTDLPTTFYAAQVYYNSDKNVVGWHELGEEPSDENAQRLHEKYPIPETFEEVKNWGKEESVEEPVEEPVEEESVEEDVVEEVPEEPVEEDVVEEPADVEKLTSSQISDYLVKISNTGDSLSLDFEEYEYKKEYDALKNQGDAIVPNVEYYLKNFARGSGPAVGCETWYYGGKFLVRLLGDINTENSLDAVSKLFSFESNVAEWYWNILSEAAEVLGNTGDKKYLEVLNNALNHSMAPVDKISKAIEKISGKKSEDPKVILNDAENKIYNQGKTLETIEHLYSLDISDWDDEDVQYYYFVLAKACERDDKLKDTDLSKAFYSAQVYVYPKHTSLGWHELGESPSEENAKRLHEKYPIPESFDEIKKLIDNDEVSEDILDEIEDVGNIEDIEKAVENIEESEDDIEDSAQDEDTDYTSSFKKYLQTGNTSPNSQNTVKIENEVKPQVSNSSKRNYALEFKNAMEAKNSSLASKIINEWDDKDIHDGNLMLAKCFLAFNNKSMSKEVMELLIKVAAAQDCEDESLKDWYLTMAVMSMTMNS